MRLRNVEGSIQAVEDHKRVISNPQEYKGQWHKFFGNENAIEIEIGMGKGDFIIQNALQYPDKNFIGIEKFSAVLFRATEKVDAMEDISNLIFFRFDAIDIHDVFAKDEVAKIYLNFSDPWPKDRWAKRRLTYHKYLEKYAMFLQEGGSLEFKTDNHDLFEFSLEEIEESKFKLDEMTRDLHRSEYKPDNIMTEYESRFLKQGKKINYLKLIYR